MKLTLTVQPDRADLWLGENRLATADPRFPRAALKALRTEAITEAQRRGEALTLESNVLGAGVTVLTITPEGAIVAQSQDHADLEATPSSQSQEEGPVAATSTAVLASAPSSAPTSQRHLDVKLATEASGAGGTWAPSEEDTRDVTLADLLQGEQLHLLGDSPTPPRDTNPFRVSATAMGLGAATSGNGSGGPLTIMVANTAGGSGKTPTAIGVLSAIAQRRGGDVTLVDLDPTGDLARRLGASPAWTILDLLGRLSDPDLPSPTVAELHDLMIYSDETKLWAVAARTATVDKKAADGVVQPELSAGEYARLHSGLASAFGVVGIDAGNNDAGRGFLEALKHTHQILIPLGWDQKTVAAALNLLANIHETGFEDLASKAIIVATTPPRIFPNRRQRQRALDTFTSHGLTIMEVPTDLHIHERSAISWSRLRPATRKAYTAIADEVLTRAGF